MLLARMRSIANTILFAGWMLPAVFARLVPSRIGGEAGDRAAGLFNVVAGGWAFLAVVYGMVIAMRMRRGIAD